MLKYLYVKEVFSEIPSEISLAVSITGCQQRCYGCHSRELWEDKGTPLTTQGLCVLLKAHWGVSNLLLMGGEHDIDSLIELFMFFHKKIKTSWYCGLDTIPKDKIGILQYLDHVKIGHYDMDLGGLNSPTTNQRLYEIDHHSDETYQMKDITYKFWMNAD